MKKYANLLKKITCAVTACVLTLGSLTLTANADSNDLTGKTAMEITNMMGKGWNLGNTFDATGGNRTDIYSQEMSWGNPKVTKELIDGVKAMGFNTIRIPVTWYKHIKKSQGYAIDPAFMARVNEVVDYAIDNEMFVILNVHHEEWVNDKDIDKKYSEIGKELAAVWSQIADNFANYDQHLIFEGMNEPRAQGTSYEWNGTAACYDAINYLNQVFVETVRSNGNGNNAERALMIPGYAASNSKEVLSSIVIPTIDGKQAENVIISVHCYSPYNFCLSDNQETFNPKNNGDTADITNMITNLNSLFINNGIPVVIGECGATNSHDNLDARIEWFKYFGNITAKNNIPAIVWDNGSIGNSGGERHNYFVRKTGEPVYPELLNAFIYGDVDGGVVKNTYIDFEPRKDGTETVLIVPVEVGFSSGKLGTATKINHTENAPLGFSLLIDDKVDYKASLDISKYTGLTIKVTAWIKAKESATIEVGINAADSKDFISGQVGDEWSKMTFCYAVPVTEDEKSICFKGSDAIYVDDISIEIIEPGTEEEATFEVVSDDTVAVEKESGKVDSNNKSDNSSANTSSEVVNNNGSNTGMLLACIAGISVVLIVLVLVVNKMAKKKKK